MQATATIIPFLPRAPAAVPPDRLALALADLTEALAAQRAAIALWRGALRDLATTTDCIGQELADFQGGLDRLGSTVAGLHEDAVATCDWADAALVIGVARGG